MDEGTLLTNLCRVGGVVCVELSVHFAQKVLAVQLIFPVPDTVHLEIHRLDAESQKIAIMPEISYRNSGEHFGHKITLFCRRGHD